MSRQYIYSIVADGGTDRALRPIVEWLVHDIDPEVEILEPEFSKRSGSLAEYLASDHVGPMQVFAHRDAESESLKDRLKEFDSIEDPRVVPVVPVRMTEAWLLLDPLAIARAAGNPAASIELPAPADLNGISDPKSLLEHLLLSAAGATKGRRRKMFKRTIVARRINVADYISDFSPLRVLPDFAAFEKSLRANYPYRTALE